MNKDIKKTSNGEMIFAQQFEYVNSIIERHQYTAIRQVNNEALLTNWEVGQYISLQLKSATWGNKVVSELAEYLKRMNPKRRGYSKRNLYNMVKFYELYSISDFARLTTSLKIDSFVQLPTAQIEAGEIVQLRTAQTGTNNYYPMPALLSITTFTNHVEIINRCRSYEERVFYMLYAAQQHLKTEELRRCIINQTYLSLLDKDKMLSPMLLSQYPNSNYILKDKISGDGSP